MISLLNLGDSPFHALFILVCGILAATLLSNVIADVMRRLIDHRTRAVQKRAAHRYE